MDQPAKQLVRHSWRRVEAIAPTAAAIFYDSTAVNTTATPPQRSARLTRLLPAVAMAVAAPAFAGVIFDRGDISIAAFAELVVDGDARGEINFDIRSGVRSPGDPKEVEAWTFGGVQGRGWQNFVGGTPTSLDSFSFASALANGAGVAGVGVSGWLDSAGFGTMQSVLNVTGDVVNVGTAGSATFTYAIPLMEIVAEGTRYNGTVATVRSRLAFARFLNDGSPPTYYSVYDYRLSHLYDKPPQTYAIESFLASPDLLRDSGGLQTIDFTGQCCGLRGVRTLPFSITTQIDNVGVGEIIEFYSIMSTEFRVGREGGGHALYGDPWQFTGGSGYGYGYGEFAAAASAVSVPEPATWALMLAGLLAAGLAQRAAASCRRSGGGTNAMRAAMASAAFRLSNACAVRPERCSASARCSSARSAISGENVAGGGTVRSSRSSASAVRPSHLPRAVIGGKKPRP